MEKIPFESKRLLTDENLGSERKKTDAALGREVKSIEQVADLALRVSREELDANLLSDRAESDRSLPKGGEVSPEVKEERRRVDERIGAQRDYADATMRVERAERIAGKEEILTSERRQTDQSLCQERTQTDEAYDLTSEMLAQEQAAHAVTKSALALRNEVLAIVSHDLQDPLSIIALCSNEFLGSRGEERLSDLEIQWVETIRRHATSMFRLVSDLLDVEYLASGDLPLAAAPCDMTVLVREMLENFQILASRQEIVLTADFGLKVVLAHADKERIRQVLANLISNALKFSPKGGKIVVRLTQVDDEVCVAVDDTGPGIAEEERTKIFERFSQLGRQDRRGVGLGLFISKWIVDAHGGKIWVEGKSGPGSTFYFSLPRASTLEGVEKGSAQGLDSVRL